MVADRGEIDPLMIETKLTCGVVIFRKNTFTTCGARAVNAISFRGDYLFSACSRHNKRLYRALPDLTDRDPVADSV